MTDVKRLKGRVASDTAGLYGGTFWREKTYDAHFKDLNDEIERLRAALEGVVKAVDDYNVWCITGRGGWAAHETGSTALAAARAALEKSDGK